MGFDPASMMLMSAAIGGAGSVMSGIGGANAANYQSQVAANNAVIAQENATRAVEASDIQATNQGLKNRAQLGSIKTAQAGNNIDVNSGSASKVQQSAQQLGMLDALTIRNRGQNEAYGYKVQAASDQAQSQLYQMQASNTLTSSLLSGASSLAGGYAKSNMYGGGSSVPDLFGLS